MLVTSVDQSEASIVYTLLPGHTPGGAATPSSAPAPAPLGHGRALDEAGVGLAVVRLQGVGCVPGRGRGHTHLHPLLELLVCLPELSNDLEERV